MNSQGASSVVGHASGLIYPVAGPSADQNVFPKHILEAGNQVLDGVNIMDRAKNEDGFGRQACQLFSKLHPPTVSIRDFRTG